MIVATSGGAEQDNSPVLVDYFGTEHLMKEAAAAGVGLVVFVSSIYANRPDHYQDVEPTSLGWKARAEEVVRSSGVPYCIVRAGWLTDGPGGEAARSVRRATPARAISRAPTSRTSVPELLFLEDARGKTFEVVAAHGGEAATARIRDRRPQAQRHRSAAGVGGSCDGSASVLLRSFALVGDGFASSACHERGVDPGQLLRREGREERPREVERLVDRAPAAALVDEAALERLGEPQQAAVARPTGRPRRRSRPAGAARVRARRTRRAGRRRARWSSRVLPAPMPAFIRRLSDGSTSIGGAIPRRSSSRESTICPSVM